MGNPHGTPIPGGDTSANVADPQGFRIGLVGPRVHTTDEGEQ